MKVWTEIECFAQYKLDCAKLPSVTFYDTFLLCKNAFYSTQQETQAIVSYVHLQPIHLHIYVNFNFAKLQVYQAPDIFLIIL